jgi:hypothetical protein
MPPTALVYQHWVRDIILKSRTAAADLLAMLQCACKQLAPAAAKQQHLATPQRLQHAD